MGIDCAYPDGIGEILIPEDMISERVRELGRQISDDYQGKSLVLVGVLKGSFMFLADLIRNISVPHTIDFVAISSYGASTESSGTVTIEKDLSHDVEGKDVLIVEDIVDTGLTLKLSNITKNLIDRKAASVRICSLLDKPSRRQVEVYVDYVGFEIEDHFVTGYGLDFDGLYRNLPFICTLSREHC